MIYYTKNYIHQMQGNIYHTNLKCIYGKKIRNKVKVNDISELPDDLWRICETCKEMR